MQKELEGLDWNGERLGSKFTYDDQEVPISGNDKFLHIDDLADPGRAWDLIKKAELALKTVSFPIPRPCSPSPSHRRLL